MRDIDVRKALFRGQLLRFKEDGRSRIVEELSLCQGDARIDIAVVNGKLHGFEIKSDKDTLERLANQVVVYSKVFDHVTLVAGEAHLDKSLQIIPSWWGVCTAVVKNGSPQIKTIRKPKQNRSIDVRAVVQLLWKEECQMLLARLGIKSTITSKSRSFLWEQLADELNQRDLCMHVRDTIKQRKDWREGVVRQHPPCRPSNGVTYIGPLVLTS
ncbi:MAG: sce7726 family protein [Desulfovibrio sp.]|nr:sce7726 family protein [Desulfovibrio sp.]MBI4960420.1 sce7726 family protein [Desulfovibrio sp.]